MLDQPRAKELILTFSEHQQKGRYEQHAKLLGANPFSGPSQACPADGPDGTEGDGGEHSGSEMSRLLAAVKWDQPQRG